MTMTMTITIAISHTSHQQQRCSPQQRDAG
jgi:hypothetical protein